MDDKLTILHKCLKHHTGEDTETVPDSDLLVARPKDGFFINVGFLVPGILSPLERSVVV